MADISQFAVPSACTIPDKAVGVWQVPELSIEIPVYASGIVGKDSQQVVDDYNSALWERWGTAYEIADHYGSISGRGIWRVDRMHPMILAYFHKPDGIHKYECYMSCIADVKPYGYRMLGTVPVLPKSSKDILCACCVGAESKRNYLSCFRFVQKVKV